MNVTITSSPVLPSFAPWSPRARVLVAEDDTEMRRLITSTLVANGYDVAEARDGMELLDDIEANARHGALDDYAAVVSDIRMPWLSGMDVLAVLQVAAWKIPVILITGFGDAETHAEGRELGAVAVLDKPFDMDELMQTVARAIADRRS